MAAPKRPTHEMVHPNQFLRTNDKFQHVPKGTGLVLSDEQAERLGGRVKSLSKQKTVEVAGGDSPPAE